MATIAVFVVLGGGAYAATKLPKNSVTTVQVKNGSLLKKDFKRGQLQAGPRGLQGVKGDAGPQGLQGLQGLQGIQGLSGAEGKDGKDGVNGQDGADAATHVRYDLASSGGVTNGNGGATAHCNQPGEKMIGGGGGFVGGFTETFANDASHIISYSAPTGSPGEAAGSFEGATGWIVLGTNSTMVASRIYAYAICVSP